MAAQISPEDDRYEARIQEAILSVRNKSFSSICAAARVYKVSPSSLHHRLSGRQSRAQAHESNQILSNAEENTLVRWITRLAVTGSFVSPALLKDLAELIRQRRVRHASTENPTAQIVDPISRKWLQRFQNRHPTIKSIYARHMENARFDGATFETIRRWFDAVAAQFLEHTYERHNIWNIDESGFGVGESQNTRILIPINTKQKHKRVLGKQEWVTDIECINAAGEALPPMLIFKAQNLNSGWLPPETPSDWHFGVSENGWTSNNLGLSWLIKVFEPQTRKKAGNNRRMLIADGHGSHIQADFIAYCMEHAIDLLIMPPHCSHLLQPLDIGIFSAFKRAHADQTDRISRHSSQRISRYEWLQLFIRARQKALTVDHILAGWRGAGLVPSDPQKVFNRLSTQAHFATSKLSTPPDRIDLNFSLLKSSPPDGTELRESNILLNSVLASTEGLASPARRYVDRVTRMAETQNTELTILRQQLREKDDLLQARKKRIRGKRVKLNQKHVYSTQNVLRIAREAEAELVAKRSRKGSRKRVIDEIDNEDEAEMSESSIVSTKENLVDALMRGG